MQATTKAGRLAVRYIKSLAMAKGHLEGAVAYASGQRWTESKQIVELIERSAVGAMNSTTDPGLIDPIGQDLALLVQPFSAVARMTGFRRVPPRTGVVSQVTGGVAYWGDPFQSGGRAIGISASSFSRATLTEKRVTALSVLTDELARSSTPEGEGVIASDLGRAIGTAVDQAFLNPYVSGSPADAPSSVTASGRIFTSTGTTTDLIDADLERLVTALHDGGSDLSSAVWCMNTLSAVRLSRMRATNGAPAYPTVSAKGGVLMGLPVLTTANPARSGSPSPGGTTLSLVDPSRIWLTDRDRVELSISKAALIDMDTAPAADASTGGGTTGVSIFQTDSTAIKAVRWIGWGPVAGQSHAASLVDVQW